MAVFSLVHGGQVGAWCFEPLIAELRALGDDAVAVDLPAGDPDAGGREYAAAVVESLRGVDEPVIVVGHSMGGLSIPLVALARPVRRLVFMCAAVPEPGRSHFQVKAEQPGEDVGEAGRRLWSEAGEAHVATPAEARQMFFHDCSPEVQEWAVSRLRRQQRRPMREVTPLERWPSTPRVFVAAEDDRCIPLEAARRTSERLFGEPPLVIAGGHFPFLSRPAEVGALLHRLA